MGKRGGGTSGVSTYVREGIKSFALRTGDTKHEICTVVWSGKDSRGKMGKFGLINVYRNIHTKFTRGLDETQAAVKEIVQKLRELDVKRVIIQGDLNSQEFGIEGLRKITHRKLYHKHNNRLAKR